MLRALARLLAAEGFAVRMFASARGFLGAFNTDAPACLALDVTMPALDGPGFSQFPIARGSPLSIVLLTGQGDIALNVRAINAGAVDFLCKPIADTAPPAAGRSAPELARYQPARPDDTAECRRRLAQLTDRECEVIGHVVAGKNE